MSEDLREEMLRLMADLCTRIAASNMSADELAKSADRLEGQPAAAAMRDVARRQRVQILQMEGQLAALNVAFAERFGMEP
jgi:hypothetical protein